MKRLESFIAAEVARTILEEDQVHQMIKEDKLNFLSAHKSMVLTQN